MNKLKNFTAKKNPNYDDLISEELGQNAAPSYKQDAFKSPSEKTAKISSKPAFGFKMPSSNKPSLAPKPTPNKKTEGNQFTAEKVNERTP